MNTADMSIRINPIYREGEAKKSELAYLYVTAQEYGHFLGKAFVHWHGRRHIFPQIQPFQGFMDRYLKPGAILTCDEAGICGKTHMGVDALGGIYQCGRAMDAGLLKYGNLIDNDFENVFDNPQKLDLDTRNDVLSKGECGSCRFFDYCHGGCPVDSYNYFDAWHHKTYFCETRKIFFEQYFEPALGVRLERRDI
jgi:radical SAM protein with 4Fe4S-binding SPASM domain